MSRFLRLRELDKKASPAPWTTDNVFAQCEIDCAHQHDDGVGLLCLPEVDAYWVNGPKRIQLWDEEVYAFTREDAELMVEARNQIESLLNLVEEAAHCITRLSVDPIGDDREYAAQLVDKILGD